MADVCAWLGVRQSGKTAWLVASFVNNYEYTVVVDAPTTHQRAALMRRLGNPLSTYTLRDAMAMVGDGRRFALYLDEYEYLDDEQWAFVIQLLPQAGQHRIRAVSTPGPKHKQRLLEL
jgi:hypothetical protein